MEGAASNQVFILVRVTGKALRICIRDTMRKNTYGALRIASTLDVDL